MAPSMLPLTLTLAFLAQLEFLSLVGAAAPARAVCLLNLLHPTWLEFVGAVSPAWPLCLSAPAGPHSAVGDRKIEPVCLAASVTSPEPWVWQTVAIAHTETPGPATMHIGLIAWAAVARGSAFSHQPP